MMLHCPPLFSIMAFEAGRPEKGITFFRQAATMDLEDTHGNTADGLHMANMAGAWICVARGFAGMRIREGKLSFSHQLPPEMQGDRLRIPW